MPPIFFIMSAIWRCIFRSRFRSWTSRPAPAAMRLLAAGLQEVGVAPLPLGHRVDQRDLAAEHPVVEAGLVHLLLHLAHAGQHAHDALHAAHLLHLLRAGAFRSFMLN